PVLRGARTRLARIVPASIIAVAVSLLLLANYQVALKAGYLPTALRTNVPKWEWAQRHAETAVVVVNEPQQAALGQHDFGSAAPETPEGLMPIAEAPAAVPEMATPVDTGTPVRKVPVVRAETSIAPAPASTPAVVAAEPEEAAAPSKVEVSAPVAPAAVAAPRKAAATTASTIKTPTGRYYVIAGAYSSLARAEQGRRNLLRAGRPARIILPHYGTRHFRLTAGDFADLASAQREAQRLRVSTRADYNTLKY
ncbi:SPOR domain-containing protein, partial [Hymenobacter agri]